MTKEHIGFSIGPFKPLYGLEGEIIVASGNRIAAISSAEAIWTNNSTVNKVALPYVPVRHARWSMDGKMIFVGLGGVDTVNCHWKSYPVLTDIIQPVSLGKGGLSVKTTSWSRDGAYVVVLLDWSGPRDKHVEPSKILVYDIWSRAAPVTLPVMDAEDVVIVGNHVIVLAGEVSVWSFPGKEIARLPPTNGFPFRVSIAENENCFVLINNDWSIRIVNTSSWKIKATWNGYFKDIVIDGHAFIALDLEGNLHAACLAGEGLELMNIINTGLPISQLAMTGDKHLLMMGAGPVSVHSVDYILNCSNTD